MARCCNDFSRTELLRRAVAEAGRGLPAIEHGMPLPAGTGLDRRSVPRPHGSGSRSPSTAARRSCRERSTRASPRRGGRAAQKVLVSVFLDGGADALSLLFPAGDPLYRKLRPRLALPTRQGLRSPRTTGCAGTRRWRRSRSCTARARSRDARRRLRPAEPVALHLAALLGGRRDRRAARAPAGSAATSTAVGTPDNPLQGLSLDWRLQPALATAKMPVASIDGPDRYDFWARGVWGDVETRMLDAIGALGAPADARRRRRSRQATDAARAVGTAVRAAAPLPAQGRQARLHEPGRLPDGRRRVPAPARRARRDARAPGCRSASSRSRRPAMYDTHDDQAQELADGLKLTADSPARVPARPRGARHRRPRSRPRLVGVRAAREGERLGGHRPRRRRHGLPDRLARRTGR